MLQNLIWRLISPLVQAAITDRIVTFHNAMLERGQIESGVPSPIVGEPRVTLH